MFKFFKKTPIIEFYCHPDLEGIIPEPKPASKYIAEWYKKIPAFIPNTRDAFGANPMTAKKCIPMLPPFSAAISRAFSSRPRTGRPV